MLPTVFKVLEYINVNSSFDEIPSLTHSDIKETKRYVQTTDVLTEVREDNVKTVYPPTITATFGPICFRWLLIRLLCVSYDYKIMFVTLIDLIK